MKPPNTWIPWDLPIRKQVQEIWKNMSHANGDAFDAFWSIQNERCGRPIPGAEEQRRLELIKRASNGEIVTLEEQVAPDFLCREAPTKPVSVPEREPGEDDVPF